MTKIKRKKKRKKIKNEIKNAKNQIKTFIFKYKSIDPLWDKIKYENEIMYPLEKLITGTGNEGDKKIFQNIIDLYNPDL